MPIDAMIDTSPGHHPDRQPRGRRVPRPQLRRAVVQRRHRQVEQRRRDQDRLPGRHRAPEPLRRSRSGSAGRSRRTFPARAPASSGSRSKWTERRAGLGVDGLSGRRDAAADGRGGQRGRQRRRATSSRASSARCTATTGATRSSRRSSAATISADTAATLTTIMEGVVDGRHREGRADPRLHDRRQDRHRGEAGRRPLLGVREQRLVRRLRCRRAIPALAIIVVIDAPHAGGNSGGAVAAPIFKRIAEAALRYLGVPPTINPAPPVLVARAASRRAWPTAIGTPRAGRQRSSSDAGRPARCPTCAA